MEKSIELRWRVNTPGLLNEILNNPGTSVLKLPLGILKSLLAEVAKRAIELDDHELNALMCRLALYEVANPDSPDYDPDSVNALIIKKSN